MYHQRIEQPYPLVIGRRELLVASLGASLALCFGEHVALAQEVVAPAEPLAVPANAVAWPKYNLDTTSTEQFMSIPGAGARMTREFEEYRPYTSIGQFRAEIGKYVGPEDVAAYERATSSSPLHPTRPTRTRCSSCPGSTRTWPRP